MHVLETKNPQLAVPTGHGCAGVTLSTRATLFSKRTAEIMLLRFQSQILQRQWIESINLCKIKKASKYKTPLAGAGLAACPDPRAVFRRAAPWPWVPAWGIARAVPSLEQHSVLVLAESQWVAGPSGWQPCSQA